MVERYVMEVGSGARELVERLRQWDGCWPAPGLDHDVERAADAITALSERVRVLEEALRKVERMSFAQSSDMLYPDTASGWQQAMDDLVDLARAALTSGGRG